MTPAVGKNGMVYFADVYGTLYAHRTDTGTKVWSFRPTSPYPGFYSSPAIGNDQTIYIAGMDGVVYALNGQTGKKKWSFQSFAMYQISTPAISSDGTLYVGCMDGFLNALDAVTGRLKWRFLANDWITSSPIVGSNGAVYVSSQDGTLHAVDASSGALKWKDSTLGVRVTPAIASDGTIVAAGGRTGYDSYLYGIEPSNGTVKWKILFPYFGDEGTNAITLDSSDNAYYITNGTLYSFDWASKVLRWSKPIGGSANGGSPAISLDGRLYANAVAGSVSVFQDPKYKFKGLNFSPYLDWQSPNSRSFITQEQIQSLMESVAPQTEWIRSFGTSDGLDKVGSIAHNLGLKAAVGAWISSDRAANDREIANLIALAKQGHVDLAIVGSEALLRNDVTESELISYINQVKAAVPNVKVTTADIYSIFESHPGLINASDVVMANFYPYWEGTKLEFAVYRLNKDYKRLQSKANGKPVYVSETGWPSAGNTVGSAIPSPENAAFYFLNFVSWARANDVQYFYFEALDEAWKYASEGPQGAHWGLWESQGRMKPGMRQVFADKTMADNWSSLPLIDGPGTPSISFTHVPPYGSFETLTGKVSHVAPSEYNVEVFIYVVGSWWVKPTYASPLTVINPDGTWSADITTGGVDQYATEIRAYLLPASVDPVPSSPGEAASHAVASVSVGR